MARTIVGILRGGSSSEYDHSLKSGAALLNALPEERYDARDLFIDKSGLWHSRGMPVDPARALSQVDVVLNALHGGAGEDGTVQRILERAGVRYAGSRPLAASVSMNKIMTREMLEQSGVRVPSGVAFSLRDGTTGDMAMKVFNMFAPPYVVKPPTEGSSIGIMVVKSLPELPDAIGDVLDAYGTALVEEFVRGHEVSTGVIENFRNDPLYVLPPAHVIAPSGSAYLHSGIIKDSSANIVVPSRFTHDQKESIMRVSKAAHRALGMTHFSNVDLILTNRGPYVLEVNASPVLHDKAPFHHMLESVGSGVRDFAEHVIAMAQTE